MDHLDAIDGPRRRPMLSLVSARYEVLHNPDPTNTRWVTAQLQEYLLHSGDGSTLIMTNEFNRYFGDPCPGEPKQLVIVFRVSPQREEEMKWLEGSTLVHVTAGDLQRSRSSPRTPRILLNHNNVLLGFPSSQHPTMHESPFPYPALPVIMSFLAVFPDRLNCQLVCKEWYHSLQTTGLTEDFYVGSTDLPDKPCYLNHPPQFLQLVVSKSRLSLRVLNLSGFAPLTNSHLHVLMQAPLIRLHVLDLTDCVQLTDHGLVNLPQSCPNLQNLTLKRVKLLTDAALIPIVFTCIYLQRLDVSELRLLTNRTFESLHPLTTLEALFLRENHAVTSVSLTPAHFHKLHELSLWGLHRLEWSPHTFHPFVQLRSLSLEGCLTLRDDMLKNIDAPLLVSLNLKFCHQLTDRALDTLSRNMPLLQHVNLAGVYKINHLSALLLLSDLRSLDVSHCYKLTSVSLCDVLRNLSKLTECKLRCCKRIDVFQIRDQVGEDPKIELLDLRDIPGANELDIPGLVNFRQQGCFIHKRH